MPKKYSFLVPHFKPDKLSCFIPQFKKCSPTPSTFLWDFYSPKTLAFEKICMNPSYPKRSNIIAAPFQLATLCNPSPPSLLGRQAFAHAALERIKLLDQNHYILYRTDCRSCNLPAKDSLSTLIYQR